MDFQNTIAKDDADDATWNTVPAKKNIELKTLKKSVYKALEQQKFSSYANAIEELDRQLDFLFCNKFAMFGYTEEFGLMTNKENISKGSDVHNALEKAKVVLKQVALSTDMSKFYELKDTLEAVSILLKLSIEFPFSATSLNKTSYSATLVYYGTMNEKVLQIIRSFLISLLPCSLERKFLIIDNFLLNFKITFENAHDESLAACNRLNASINLTESYNNFFSSQLFCFRIIEIFVNIDICLQQNLYTYNEYKNGEILDKEKHIFYKAIDYMDRLWYYMDIKSWVLYKLPMLHYFAYHKMYKEILLENFLDNNGDLNLSFFSDFVLFVNQFLLDFCSNKIDFLNYKHLNDRYVVMKPFLAIIDDVKPNHDKSAGNNKQVKSKMIINEKISAPLYLEEKTVEVISLQTFKDMKLMSLKLFYEMFPFLDHIIIKSIASQNYWNIDTIIICLQFETQSQITKGHIVSKNLENTFEKDVYLNFEECVSYLTVKFPSFSSDDIESLLIQNDCSFEKTLDILTKVSLGDTDALLPFIEDPVAEIEDPQFLNTLELVSALSEKDDGNEIEFMKINDFEEVTNKQSHYDNLYCIDLLQSIFTKTSKFDILNLKKSLSLDRCFFELALKLQYKSLYTIIEEEVEVEEEITKTLTVEEEEEIYINTDELAIWKDAFPQVSFLSLKRCIYKSNGNSDLLLNLIEEEVNQISIVSLNKKIADKHIFDTKHSSLKKEVLVKSFNRQYGSEIKRYQNILSGTIDTSNLEDINVFQTLSKKIFFVKKLGLLTLQFAECCLEQADFNVGLALLYAVTKYKTCELNLKRHFKTKKNKTDSSKLKLSYCDSLKQGKNKYNKIFIKPSNLPFTSKTLSIAEVDSLLNIIKTVPRVESLREEFLKLLIMYFNGDIQKACDLALLFLKMKLIKHVNDSVDDINIPNLPNVDIPDIDMHDSIDVPLTELVVKSVPTTTILKKKKRVKKRIPINREFLYSSKDSKKKAEDNIDRLFADYIIDISEFEIIDAVFTVSKAAKLWWSEELQQRERNSSDQQIILKRGCQYTPYLRIVNSSDVFVKKGLSHVSQTCMEYLKCNGYLIMESPRSFTVVGKLEVRE
ncbi:hypothetical protein QEN19_002735 [Hanseniaspora menglaensis]